MQNWPARVVTILWQSRKEGLKRPPQNHWLQEDTISAAIYASGSCLHCHYWLQKHGFPAKSAPTNDECPACCLSMPSKLASGSPNAATANLHHLLTSRNNRSHRGTALASFPLSKCLTRASLQQSLNHIYHASCKVVGERLCSTFLPLWYMMCTRLEGGCSGYKARQSLVYAILSFSEPQICKMGILSISQGVYED